MARSKRDKPYSDWDNTALLVSGEHSLATVLLQMEHLHNATTGMLRRLSSRLTKVRLDSTPPTDAFGNRGTIGFGAREK